MQFWELALKILAAKGIGNAVCPLVMQRIYEGLLGA